MNRATMCLVWIMAAATAACGGSVQTGAGESGQDAGSGAGMPTNDASSNPTDDADGSPSSPADAAPGMGPALGDSSAPEAGSTPVDGSLGTGPEWVDVTIHLNRDAGSADPACVGGTDVWIEQVNSLLSKDRPCLVDDDCTYVSFGDPCASICPIPLNKLRIGEFGTTTSQIAASSCTSCPVPDSFAPCPAPGAVHCSVDGWCNFVH